MGPVVQSEAKASDEAGAMDARQDEALACAYALYAELVDGIDERTLELARMSPALVVAIGDVSAEPIAADHCHIFDLVAPAFEGLVLDPEGRVGNAVADELREMLAGLAIELRAEAEAEHLAVLLEVMARLCERTANAPTAIAVERARADCAAFLDRHLLSWLLVYETAVARCGRAFPGALVADIVELASEHRAALSQPIAPAPLKDGAAVDLSSEDTDLRAIAEHLTTPAACGLLLTRDDLTRIGRAARVPRGFGSRKLMMQHLLRNAAGLGELDKVVAELRALCSQQRQMMVARVAPFGGRLDAAITPWLEALTATEKVLDRIAATLAEGENPPSS